MREGLVETGRDEVAPFDVRSSLIRGGVLGGLTFLVLVGGLVALKVEVVPPWSVWVFIGVALVFAVAFAFDGFRSLRQREQEMRGRIGVGLDESLCAGAEGVEPTPGAPGQDQTMKAVRRSVERRLVWYRRRFWVTILLAMVAFWLLTGYWSQFSLLQALPGALVWGVLFGPTMWWTLARAGKWPMESLKTSTKLIPGRITGSRLGFVTIGTDDECERSWRFGRKSRELSPGQGVWLVQGEAGPAALAYGTEAGRVATILWPDARQPFLVDYADARPGAAKSGGSQ